MFENVLKPTEYDCFYSDKITSALKIIKNEKFDVLINDFNINMVESNRFLEQIRSIDKIIEILLIFEDDDIQISKILINYNIFSYFTRPINIRKLVEVLHEINRINLNRLQNNDIKENYL